MRTCSYPALLMLIVLAVAGAGCGPGEERGAESLPADLEAAITAFYAAIEAGDAEARLALFSDDAAMMPNHWTMYRGRQAIAEVARAEGWIFRLRDRKLVDSGATGDLAYTVNSYFYTYHAEGSEPQWHKTKNVHIWKRDGAGLWKLHLDIWNSDVPMSQFAAE
ncbi:MAG: nuclear transport factor 2 family protein [bacterium]